ncbi:MAG TPA: 8-amino-7-oxononanoate synthase [Gammaproteobacteria bacterium]|jgi:8-amino-7-oxononanoate synthase|nr:8-amino-7-oxononanoate synthase [Gammaproteobacteria bacterium]
MLTIQLKKQLAHYDHSILLRNRQVVSREGKNKIRIKNQQLLNFSSNDYLGMTHHPAVKKAFIQAIKQYGVGSGSAALVSGWQLPHEELEKQFAAFLGRERALLFNSGYLANLGVITVLAQRKTAIVADRLCHASLLDGIQLTRAKHYRYRHCDIMHAADLLKKNAQSSILLVTESVFSMEGDIAPIKDLALLAKQSDAAFIVDDAHGIGVLGQQGRGISESAELDAEAITCLITPLGKAFGGMGAIVSASHTVIEAIMQFARSYRYTTAISPAIAAAMLKTLILIQQETWRREKLRTLIQFFIEEAIERGLSLLSTALTPIKSIIVGDNQQLEAIEQQLLTRGLLVACIRPPTVANGTARIRISLNCLHSKKDILFLLDNISLCLNTK